MASKTQRVYDFHDSLLDLFIRLDGTSSVSSLIYIYYLPLIHTFLAMLCVVQAIHYTTLTYVTLHYVMVLLLPYQYLIQVQVLYFPNRNR